MNSMLSMCYLHANRMPSVKVVADGDYYHLELSPCHMQGSCHKWRPEGGYGGALYLHSTPKIWLQENHGCDFLSYGSEAYRYKKLWVPAFAVQSAIKFRNFFNLFSNMLFVCDSYAIRILLQYKG